MPRFRRASRLVQPVPSDAAASSSNHSHPSSPDVTEDPELGTVHYIPAPKKYRKGGQSAAGETFNGRRLATAVYGGVRRYVAKSGANKTVRPPKAIHSSPGHSSTLGTPHAQHTIEFDPIEEDPLEEDVGISPATLLGAGYSTSLARDPVEANSHHRKWRRITANRWQDLLPTMVMPYLRWCHGTQYGCTKPTPTPLLPCTCGQMERSTVVRMVYNDCKYLKPLVTSQIILIASLYQPSVPNALFIASVVLWH
jgi:hypothetical protein